MNPSALPARYALVLMRHAEQRGVSEQILQDVLALRQAIQQNPVLHRFLFHPLVPAASQNTLLHSLQHSSLQEGSRSFLRLLEKKQRLRLLPEILDSFLHLANTRLGQVTGTLFTPKPATQEQLEALTSKWQQTKGTRLHLETHLDPTLLGGFLLKIEDRVYDHSIGGKLARFRQQFLSSKNPGVS